MFTRRMFNLPRMGWRDPFAEMDRISREMNLLSNAVLGRPGLGFLPSRVFPAINLTEDKDRYYARAELPGMKAEDIELQVHGRNLTISGERKITSDGENEKYHRREREAGKFARVIGLPGDIDADKVDATMVNGVLLVAAAKSEAAKPKQISVN